MFISYQRDHVESITSLVKLLENSGKYRVWYDQKIDRGKWWDHIIEQIQLADVVVLAVSRTYLNSEPCKRERDYARQLNKAILPINVDADRNYFNSLPDEVKELQIIPYSGRADEYLQLMAALDKEQSPPLPDPLPIPPPAPIQPTVPVETHEANSAPQRRMVNRRLAVGGVVGLVIGVLLLLFALNSRPGFEASPTQAVSQPTSVVQSTTEEEPMQPGNQQGAFDITLRYGGVDSFIVQVNNPSNLVGVTLTTSAGVNENLIERFPDLATFGDQIPQGTCIVYERENARPVLPLSCDASKVHRIAVSPSTIFWFDDGNNLYTNVILRRDELTHLCPHDNGGGSCNISAEA